MNHVIAFITSIFLATILFLSVLPFANAENGEDAAYEDSGNGYYDDPQQITEESRARVEARKPASKSEGLGDPGSVGSNGSIQQDAQKQTTEYNRAAADTALEAAKAREAAASAGKPYPATPEELNAPTQYKDSSYIDHGLERAKADADHAQAEAQRRAAEARAADIKEGDIYPPTPVETLQEGQAPTSYEDSTYIDHGLERARGDAAHSAATARETSHDADEPHLPTAVERNTPTQYEGSTQTDQGLERAKEQADEATQEYIERQN